LRPGSLIFRTSTALSVGALALPRPKCAGRRGPKKAILAVAASILTAVYHMLKDGTFYQDLGPNHVNPSTKERQKNRLIKRLADLGYAVELSPLPN
jgi:hypothetical protein